MEQKIFVDNYDHLSDDIEYILENILQDDDESEEFKKLKDLYNLGIAKCCECESGRCEDCCHGGNYEMKNGEIILKVNRRCQDLIYECNDFCRVTTCHNKLVQYGPRADLQISNFNTKGFGLISTKLIAKGSFICEYAGEILTKTEATRRDQQNQLEGIMNYVFCLNEIGSESSAAKIQTFIDPSKKGNIGRYINHSCDANCDIISTRIDSLIPRIAIFANRDISPFSEITFYYGYKGHENNIEHSKKCLCGSHNCKIYLPNFSFQ